MPDIKQYMVEAQITKLFADELNIQILSATTDLFETGILDSQMFVELLLHLEERFGTQINSDDFEIDNFRCIERIAALVLRRKKVEASLMV